MNAENKNEESIFYEAIKIESPTEREAFVKSACGKDIELLKRVEGLLKFHYEDKRFLKSSPAGINITLDNSTPIEGPGTKIDHYKLLELIGEGGFGMVYMAEQEKPIRRKVALKIIKLGMDTKRVIARFEAERQALAMMDHTNIAKVLDAGATETGRPYFVMELVNGIPITEYCDKNNLNTQQRLKLFIDVCKAVQHAHQKGIIHRDIKPSNVMITLHDGKPVPKVIDFGIAKATNQRLTEKTVFTRYAQMIGTPEYMSPEQAEMSGLDVDTRTDIYSLGVLLYELLTGATPFDAQELREASYVEMQRIIKETEPPKPSTKLSTMTETLPDIAKHRQTNPDSLSKLIRGELDWIVMKSLEKDRTRRYETASEFAQDIQRHLGNVPVTAGPPSSVYRLRKFICRNRTLVISVAVVLVVLSAGIVVSTIFAVGQYRARAQAEELIELLYTDILGSFFPQRFVIQEISSRDILDSLSKSLDSKFNINPRAEAFIRWRLGLIYQALGELKKAETNLKRSVQILPKHGYGAPVPILNLAQVYQAQGRYEDAEQLLTDLLATVRQTLGERHWFTGMARNGLVLLYKEQGRYEEAEQLLNEREEVTEENE